MYAKGHSVLPSCINFGVPCIFYGLSLADLSVLQIMLIQFEQIFFFFSDING